MTVLGLRVPGVLLEGCRVIGYRGGGVSLERRDPTLPPSVTFWESLTGSRYLHKVTLFLPVD